MRYILVLAAAVLAVVQTAEASSCLYKGSANLGRDTATAVNECWDMSAWAAGDFQNVCPDTPNAENKFGTTPLAACPAGFVAKCEGAKYEALKGIGSTTAYYDHFPPELVGMIQQQVAARVKEFALMNKEKLAPMQRYDGTAVNIYYYDDASAAGKPVDRQKDCAERQGKWVK